MHSHLAYRPRLIWEVGLLRKKVDTNTKKKLVRYKSDYDKHVRIKPIFTAGEHIVIKRPPLVGSTTDRMASEGLFKRLLRSTGSYGNIKDVHKYAKIL